MSDVDVDDDGLVSYSEFAPLCFDILVERFKDDVLAEAALESADALTMALIEEFQRKETTIGGKDEPLGKMHRNLVKQALVDLSAEFLGAVQASDHGDHVRGDDDRKRRGRLRDLSPRARRG